MGRRTSQGGPCCSDEAGRCALTRTGCVAAIWLRKGYPFNPLSNMDMDAAACPICFDTIFPCEEVVQTECAPIWHIIHVDCCSGYLQAQPRGLQATSCPVCRQFVLGEMVWIDLATIFGYESRDYECVEQLPAEAQHYARRFQRGEVTEEQLRADVDAILDVPAEDED